MEHYRSVFATAAAIVFGLATASHVLYPRGTEDDRPALRTSFLTNAAQAAPAAWVDLPKAKAVRQGDIDVATGGDVSEPVRRLPAFTLLAPDTAALLTATGTIADATAQTGSTGRRRRMTRHVARLRTADAAPTQPVQTAAAERNGAKPNETAPRVNLIGDLLKNLGIGRES